MRLISICRIRKISRRQMNVYVSGIQPNGMLHIGNYLGFLQPFLDLQLKSNGLRLLSIADLHAVTTGFPSVDTLRKNVIETAAALLACGVDTEKTVLIQQSQILEHTQLCWILMNTQTLPFMQRLAQFKDKSSRLSKVSIGLLSYPILMAADILLYKGTHVHVGEDQNQHLKVARHTAEVFNATFNTDYFPIPEQMLSNWPRIKSLRDATKKMSKSDRSVLSRIELTDSADIILQKCKRAQSDSIGTISFDPEMRLGVSNLVLLYSSVVNKCPDDVVKEFQSTSTEQFKEALAVVLDTKLAPIRAAYSQLSRDEAKVRRIMSEGSDKGRELAEKHMREIKKIIGFE